MGDPYAGLGVAIAPPPVAPAAPGDDPYANIGAEPVHPSELSAEQRNAMLQEYIRQPHVSASDALNYAGQLGLRVTSHLAENLGKPNARVRDVTPPPPAPPPPDTSWGHNAAVVGNAVLHGGADILNTVDTFLNPAAHLAPQIMRGPDTSAGGQVEALADRFPFGQPETPTQEYVHAGVRGVTAAAPFGVAGGARVLAGTAVSGATSSLSSEFARQKGYGRGVQFAAGLFGGLVPGFATFRTLARNAPEAALPTVAQNAPPPVPRGPMASIARITGADRTVGARLVAQRLHDDGINPYDAGRVISEAQANGTPAVLADLGENTRALAGSVSRQTGPARTIAKGFTKERQMGQMDRVRDAINRDLGPTTDVLEESNRLIQRARSEAAPIYERAYAAPVMASPRLQAILNTPAGRAALKRAHTIAANEGKDPAEMGLLLGEDGQVVLQPGKPLSFAESQRANPGTFDPITAPNERDVLASRSISGVLGGTIAARGPIDLSQRLRQLGGIQDQGGELTSMGVSNTPRRLNFGNDRGLGSLINNETGMPLDEAARRLHEEGWFPNEYDRPTPDTLLDALRSEHVAGQRIFHPRDQAEVEAYEAAQADRGRVDTAAQEGAPLVHDKGQPISLEDLRASSPPPTAGRLPELVPHYRTETLDYVKRGLDDIIEQYREPLTGKLKLDESGHAINSVKNRLLTEVDRLNPDYRDARRAYAGPASLNSAMRDGKAALNKSASEINQRIKDMTPAEAEQYGLGLRSAIADALERSPDGANKVRALIGNPNRRAVLQRVFGGKANLDRFVASMENEQAAFETHQAVHGNSATQARAMEDHANSDLNLVRGVGSDLAAVGGGHVGIGLRVLERGADLLRFGAGKAGQRAREDAASLLFSTSPSEFRDALGKITLQSRRDLYRRQGLYPVAGATVAPLSIYGMPFGTGSNSAVDRYGHKP